MIVEIEGVIGERRPGLVVIRTASGLGYGVEVPRETEERMPPLGEWVRLYTYLLIREDQWRLMGFSSTEERQVFQDLLEVTGVGIKGALSVMSHLGVERLRQAVLSGDWKELKGAAGIGAKIAQRIQLELMGRWVKSPTAGTVAEGRFPTVEPSHTDEVITALMGLGYQLAEAEAAVRLVTADTPEDRLRAALKSLDRGGRVNG